MIIGFFAFFIFLFSVYLLSKDDFILLRKGVSIESVFNIVFLGFLPILFFARLGYVLIHSNKIYLNPFVFFIVPYFPGMSLVGGMISASILLLWYGKRKKLPVERLFDIFGISYLYALGAWLIGDTIGIVFHPGILLVRGGVCIMLTFFLAILATRVFAKNTWTEGFLGFSAIGYSCLLLLGWYGFSFMLTKQSLSIGDGTGVALLGLCCFGLFLTRILSKHSL